MSKNTIKIHRVSEYMNAMREISIYINNKKVGTIRNGELKEFKVPAGKFTLHTKIDWLYSEKLELMANKKEDLKVEISSPKILSVSVYLSFFVVLAVFLINYFEWLSLGDFSYVVALAPFALILMYFFTFGRSKYIRIRKV